MKTKEYSIVKENLLASILHDSNKEQPEGLKRVLIYDPKTNDGEILSHCLSVNDDHLWSYWDDFVTLIKNNIKSTTHRLKTYGLAIGTNS